MNDATPEELQYRPIRGRDSEIYFDNYMPITYRRWNGGFGQVRLADEYQDVGIIPRPATVWQRLSYHYHHGRLMRYPWLSVVVFTLRFSWRRFGRTLLEEIEEESDLVGQQWE